MKELVSFIGNQYLTASEQLTMHCKDKAKEIVSFQVLPPDTIYAVIDDNNEIKDPLDSYSFFDKRHIYNKFTIAEWDVANSSIQILNNLK